MLRIARFLLVLIAALLVACGPAAPGGGITSAPTIAPPPQPTGGPTTVVAATDVLITYHKTGGIDGIDETMTVHGNGALDLVSRNGAVSHEQATPEEIAQLRMILDSDDFARLAPSYPASGADLFTYTLTIPTGPSPRTVMIMDGAQRPPALDQAITQLERLRNIFN